MSAAAGRVAGKMGAAASKAAGKAAETGNKSGKQGSLQKGAKRDPELYVGHQEWAGCSPQDFVNDETRSYLQS